LPDSPEEVIDLNRIIHYVSPPVDLLTWQDEYIDKLTTNCKKTVFNSDLFSREQIQETATGKNIDLQAVYDTLYPFAVSLTDHWDFYVNCVADITDMDTGLNADMTFDRDFKLMSESDMIFNIKNATESGADPTIIQDMQKDLMKSKFSDRPKQYTRWETKQKYFPFSGYSDEQIAVIISSGYVSKFYKILYNNYGIIFDEIEREIGFEFYLYADNKQWAIITKKVEDYETKIDEQRIVNPLLEDNGE
jgi:hypothetical protein